MVVPAPHEALGPAVLRRPLRRVRVRVVIGLLHHPRLVLVGEQREKSRILIPQQLGVPVLSPVPHVAPAPVARHRGVGVLCRSAAAARLVEERLVVGLCGLELVGADDRLARVVPIAVSPRGRCRRLVADHLAPPLLLETIGTVAPEVPLVGPQRAVGVEVLGREDVDRERLDPFRCGAVACRAEEPIEPVAGRGAIERAHQPVLFRVALDLRRWNRLDVLGIPPHLPGDGRGHGSAAAHAREFGRRRLSARARHQHGRRTARQARRGGLQGIHVRHGRPS